MRPARYHLVSNYRLSSDREAVWDALQAVPQWPSWWRWLKSVDVIKQPASEDGIGGTYRHRIGSPLRYGFTYQTEVVDTSRPDTINLRSSGDLEGRGRFDLAEDRSGGTDLTFTWLVHTPKWWMNQTAPIGRPAFCLEPRPADDRLRPRSCRYHRWRGSRRLSAHRSGCLQVSPA